MSGISCELCINEGINHQKARNNAEALCGGVLRALGMGQERIKRHWDFNAGTADRHHCPDSMMTQNYWPQFVANAGQIIVGGGASQPEPEYPNPAPVPWNLGVDLGWKVLNGVDVLCFNTEVTALRNVVPRAWASTSAPASAPTYKKGEMVSLTGQMTAGRRKWSLDMDGNRVLSSAFDVDMTIRKRSL